MSPGGLPVLPELLSLPEPLEPPLLAILPLLPLPPLPLGPKLPELPVAPELPALPPELAPLPVLDPLAPDEPPVLLPLWPLLTPLEPVPAPLPLLDPVVAAPDEPLPPSGAPPRFGEVDDEPHAAAAANERARNAAERTDIMMGHYLHGSPSWGSTTDRVSDEACGARLSVLPTAPFCVANFDAPRTIPTSTLAVRAGGLAVRRHADAKRALGHAFYWAELTGI